MGISINNVTPVNGALPALLYDANGGVLVQTDRAQITPGATSGIPSMGFEFQTARVNRCSPDGSLRTTADGLLLYDAVEGAAVDTNKWVQTLTTMTIVQAAGVITFNGGSSVAINVGAQQLSNRWFAKILRSPLIFRSTQRHTQHFNGNLIEQGFGSPTTAITNNLVNGAVWRKDGTGQYVPVLIFNGSEVLGTPISNATWLTSVAPTDYFVFEIFLTDSYAKFSAYTLTGTLISEQTISYGTTVLGFTQTHLQACNRTYNAAATGTAVQLLLSNCAVYKLDDNTTRDVSTVQAAMAYNQGSSPTAYTQLSNYANSAAPASAVLANTTAGYVNLGGQFQFAAVAGAETDYALFGLAIPIPYHFYFRGIRIETWNTVVPVATTPTLMQWGMAFNSSAVSLATAAPYSPMRFAIGAQTFAVGAAVGAKADAPVYWQPAEPICVMPGKFIHVILKMPLGTATATEIFRGTCAIDGYFE